ncbi:MAG: 3-deoxy-manno-octulosonate cytidylyltransferase [Selenomonadaceae bacterium]|nr:3-deoxy-manno-octulosonate cytidylyltransferase [Selenomonadaceae bacterium]
MKSICVIPARYSSTRLPGKPLKEICGVPMICIVYDRASQAKLIDKAIVATDDERIFKAVKDHGGEVMMTRADHPTGTDRLAEVANNFDNVDLIVNVQGDEPLIEPSLIDALISLFNDDENLQMATVATELKDIEEIKNPNNVKVVTDQNNYALYFSRSQIPYPRNANKSPFYKHIGIYAYRREFLLKYAKMSPTPLEQSESLEQLRALENGYKIKVLHSDNQFIGVDTEEDLKIVNEIYSKM